MIELALLWTLAFTAPTRQAAAAAICPCGAGAPLSRITRFEVWKQQQSPTWLMHRDQMLADQVEWLLWWPGVRVDAAPVLVDTLPPMAPGSRVTVSMPDSLPTGWFYFVRTVDGAGASCPSNAIWR